MSIIDLQRRIDRLAPPRPLPEDDPYLARLTPDQMMQAADLRARLDAVGPEGLTEDERAIADELRAALLGETGDMP
jgi:hypothetical protein